jgi:hypothetical protein
LQEIPISLQTPQHTACATNARQQQSQVMTAHKENHIHGDDGNNSDSSGRSGVLSSTVCQAVDANASGGASSQGRLRQSEQALLTPGEHQTIAYQLRKSQTL